VLFRSEGVVVFVAPTKALSLQVYHEARARFDKKGKTNTNSVVGIFTRDFRANELSCQILVTVPQCLMILGLCELNAGWLSRIKYLILDEFHSIDSGDDGSVWEQIVHVFNCPMLYQSATLGDCSRVMNWLKHIHDLRGRECHYIKHTERYNDLVPSVFTPDHKVQPFSQLALMFAGDCLNLDVHLIPEACWDLYKLLKRHAGSTSVANFEPVTFFRKRNEDCDWNLSTRDVITWQTSLKAFASQQFEENSTRLLQSVKEAFQPPEPISDSPHAFITDLVLELKKKDMLPCIVFHLSRKNCETLAERVLTDLEATQVKARSSSHNEQIRNIENRIVLLEKKLGKGTKTKGSNAEQGEERDALLAEISTQKQRLHVLVHGVDPNHTASPNAQQSPLEEEVAEAVRDKFDDQNVLHAALRRGVGYHHGGMSKFERQGCERLFRTRKVGVLIATGTLACGINMPCRSVVILGTPPFLTPLMFRQMAGRAGRRGKDNRGHVIIANSPFHVFTRLMTAPMPMLQGTIGLDASLTMRAAVCYSTLPPNLRTAFEKEWKHLLGSPLLKQDVPIFEKQLIQCFHFCCDYLAHLDLMDENGKPNSVCTLVTHLFWTTPCNLLLISLLSNGVIDRIYDQENISEIEKDRQLVTLMAHLFQRYPIETVSNNPHQLPPLSADALKTVDHHNENAMTIVHAHWQCFARAFETEIGVDNKMPMSNKTFSSTALPLVSPVVHPTRLRSQFLAITNPSDSFATIGEMCSSLRTGLFLDPCLVPIFQPMPALNSYLVDFFKHGDMRAIVHDNCIPDEILHESLYNFSLVLRACWAALDRRLQAEREAGLAVDSLPYASKATIAGFSRVATTMADRMPGKKKPRKVFGKKK